MCPTTLKRVCRQYSIPRWPCRKLKKVNRQVSRLAGVVESVPGVDAAALGFPDLKAACVFDTSLSGSLSGMGQEAGPSSGAAPIEMPHRSRHADELDITGSCPGAGTLADVAAAPALTELGLDLS